MTMGARNKSPLEAIERAAGEEEAGKATGATGTTAWARAKTAREQALEIERELVQRGHVDKMRGGIDKMESLNLDLDKMEVCAGVALAADAVASPFRDAESAALHTQVGPGRGGGGGGGGGGIGVGCGGFLVSVVAYGGDWGGVTDL
jgi:hypothetical protein